MQDSSSKSGKSTYSGNDVDIVSVLDGHERGVNWCDFHPTVDLICSGSDDRKLKLWKYKVSDSKAWEDDSLFGH